MKYILKFKSFSVICFKDSYDLEGANQLYKDECLNTDLIKSESKKDFVEQLRSIGIKKIEYINYWKQNANKSNIEAYDELISSAYEIEQQLNLISGNFFIARKN